MQEAYKMSSSFEERATGIPVEKKLVPCRFGCEYAIARFALPNGCFCYPDEREQDLCAQHVVRTSFTSDGMHVVHVYDADFCRQMGIIE